MISESDVLFLKDLTLSVLEAARVRPGEWVLGKNAVGEETRSGPNTSGGTLIRPGGFDCYPAFWIRDFAMSLPSGLVPVEEQLHALRFTARHQCDEAFHCCGGSYVPKGSICDHISFTGESVYFPGVYDPKLQGAPFGGQPPLDDQFYFVEMAWNYVQATQHREILNEVINGLSLWQRINAAFFCAGYSKETELAFAPDNDPAVNFGFYDSVIHSGNLLFASILRWRAACMLASLSPTDEEQRRFTHIAKAIQSNLARVFKTEMGLLKASTGRSAQQDVWGSAYAVYCGILSPKEDESISRALLRLYGNQEIAWRGNIRHVPISGDASETSCWGEARIFMKKNTYQHGAYWGTPTGWIAFCLGLVDVLAAKELLSAYLLELREGDFRHEQKLGSPWECIHPDGNYRQNPAYLTSVSVPYGVLKPTVRCGGDTKLSVSLSDLPAFRHD
jgi:hypothetical protein